MSSHKSHRFARAALGGIAGTALLTLPAGAMAGIVVASSGPSAKTYPPGTKLPDDARITLKASDRVTILDKRGTRVLSGAGTYTVGTSSGPSRTSTFVALTTQRSASRVRTGAVRGSGPDGKPLRPNLWYVDVTSSGPVCVVDAGEVRAWRPSKDGAAAYETEPAAGGAAMELSFQDGSMVAPWGGAPVAEGASYAIAPKGKAPEVKITFRLLPQQDYAPEDLAEALLAKGCEGQVNVLAHSLALPQG
ncbi:MAG TPA: hypothetical protein VJQ77_05520 [Novosphingobium sp.]|nr:hypothetical protein [Novosphingobium sp.]